MIQTLNTVAARSVVLMCLNSREHDAEDMLSEEKLNILVLFTQ
jgi:hypothetical protein